MHLPKIVSIFIPLNSTLFHQTKVGLTHGFIKNDTSWEIGHFVYNNAKLRTPTLPETLRAVGEEMHKVFAWRDTVIKSIADLYHNNSDSSSPDRVFETLSVESTP